MLISLPIMQYFKGDNVIQPFIIPISRLSYKISNQLSLNLEREHTINVLLMFLFSFFFWTFFRNIFFICINLVTP